MNGIYGAILGDIVGSPYEEAEQPNEDFPLFPDACHFTDDTVLTFATMDLLLEEAIQKGDTPRIEAVYRKWAKRFPDRGYGWLFLWWVNHPKMGAYGSGGNGAAMRISPVAYAAQSEEECRCYARAASSVTHNSVEGLKGSEAIAILTYLALHGANKETIEERARVYYPQMASSYGSLLGKTKKTALAEDTVPAAIVCFLDSLSFEDCLRKAVCLGGDTDTLAALSGSIAGPFYGIDDSLIVEVLEKMDDENVFITLMSFIKRFIKKDTK
jgi:ADP-ribosyl-[dinitrogen reductase] hydrolase